MRNVAIHFLIQVIAATLSFHSFSAFAGNTLFSVCKIDAQLYRTKVLPPLGKGMPVGLSIAENSGGKTSVVREMVLGFDLWKNTYTVAIKQPAEKRTSEKTAHEKSRRFDGLSETPFVERLCAESELESHADGAEREWLVILNPRNAEVRELVENWAERNAGIYRNLGLRMRWLTEDPAAAEGIVLLHHSDRKPGP